LAYEGRREHTKAVADFSVALRHGHYNPAAYSGRAKAYRALGEVARAESDEATAREQTDWPDHQHADRREPAD
jgi:Tfp pilus assembly protein PilF